MTAIQQKIRNAIREFIIGKGFFVTRATTPQMLDGFFKQIKPYTTDRKLIRIGGAADGGYLVPDDFEGIEVCFSPGVSDVAGFELDLAKKNIKCFMADYSVESPPCTNSLFDFEKKYLGIQNDDVFMTLESWIENKAPGASELILQMDIEGAEYGVILNTAEESLRRFRIIVIEFHNLDAMFDRNGFDLINMTFNKLLQHFDIVHIHPNNCRPVVRCGDHAIPPVMEITFLRKDRISSRQPNRNFPHALDVKNFSKSSDVALPVCWQG